MEQINNQRNHLKYCNDILNKIEHHQKIVERQTNYLSSNQFESYRGQRSESHTELESSQNHIKSLYKKYNDVILLLKLN